MNNLRVLGRYANIHNVNYFRDVREQATTYKRCIYINSYLYKKKKWDKETKPTTKVEKPKKDESKNPIFGDLKIEKIATVNQTSKFSKESNETITNSKTEHKQSELKKNLKIGKAKNQRSSKNKNKTVQEMIKDVSKELHPNEVKKQKNVKMDIYEKLVAMDQKLKQVKSMKESKSATLNNKGNFSDKIKKESGDTPKINDEIKKKSGDHPKIYRQKNQLTELLDLLVKGKPQIWDPPANKKDWTAEDYYNMYKNEYISALDNAQGEENDFDKHIKWTQEGKLWTFPINNEQGMEHETKVSFQSHVFLDDKLNEGGWCPEKGPIRLFMNAVITSLSQNPYFSVEEKHEHIDWFRNYFTEKLTVLTSLGLMNSTKSKSQSGLQ